MPQYTSEIAAALAKIDGLNPALFPGGSIWPVYFAQAPLYDGGQINPPFLVLIDNANEPTAVSFGTDSTVSGGFTIEAYANTIEDLDLAMNAIRWNGLPPDARMGFDYGTLSLKAPLVFLEMRPTRNQHSYAGLDKNGKRVYLLSQSYSTLIQIRGSGEV